MSLRRFAEQKECDARSNRFCYILLTPEDIRAIESAFLDIKVEAAQYPDFHER